MKSLKLFSSFVFVSILFLVSASHASATTFSSTPNPATFGTDSYIDTMAPDSSGSVYIGGVFTYVSGNQYNGSSGPGIIVLATTGSSTPTFPVIGNNAVNSVIPDGNGGW